MRIELLQSDGTTYIHGGVLGAALVTSSNVFPNGATPLIVYSGSAANATATATLAAAAGKTTYITGFEITGSGATAASIVTATVSNIGAGGTSVGYTIAVAAGATLGNAPLIVTFVPPQPAFAANQAIAVSVPALGAGNTNSTVVVHGFQL